MDMNCQSYIHETFKPFGLSQYSKLAMVRDRQLFLLLAVAMNLLEALSHA